MRRTRMLLALCQKNGRLRIHLVTRILIGACADGVGPGRGKRAWLACKATRRGHDRRRGRRGPRAWQASAAVAEDDTASVRGQHRERRGELAASTTTTRLRACAASSRTVRRVWGQRRERAPDMRPPCQVELRELHHLPLRWTMQHERVATRHACRRRERFKAARRCGEVRASRGLRACGALLMLTFAGEKKILETLVYLDASMGVERRIGMGKLRCDLPVKLWNLGRL